MNTCIAPSQNPLKKEFSTFEKVVGEYQKQGREGFLVIRGDEVLDIFDTRVDGAKAGLAKWGNVSFLVRSINPEDHIIRYLRNVT